MQTFIYKFNSSLVKSGLSHTDLIYSASNSSTILH